jgi:tetratricopeptide (TPR) repeat protein
MEIGELDAAAFFTKVEQNLAPVDAYLSAANLNDLGLNAYRQGNFGEAEEKYQAAIRLIERDGSSEAAAVYVNLADVFMKTGRVDDAESLLNEALALRLRHNGERTPETATVLQAFGNLNMQRKEYLESLKYHQEALEIRKQCLGPDHVDVGRSLYNVSAILFNLGKFCESIRTTRQAQEILCKTWQQGDQRLQVVDQLIESYTGLTEALTAHPTTTGIVIPVWSGSTGIIAAENSLPAREALSQAVTRFANAMLARRAGLPILLLSLSGFENLPAELASLWSEFGLPANMVESITVPHSNKPDGKLDMGVIRELSVIPGRFARWVANNRLETLIVSPLHIPAGIDWTLVEYVKTCGKAMVSELMPFGPVWGPLVGAKNLGGGQTKVAFITPGSCQRQGYSPQPADSVSTGIFYLNLIKIKNMLVESSQENSGLLKNLLKQQKSTDLNKSLQSKISTALSEAEANPQTGQEIADWLFCELVDLFGTALVNDLSEKRNIRYDLLPDHRTH